MWTASLLILNTFLFQINKSDCDQCFLIPGDYAASHILISHDGADRVQDGVTRSKKEARAKAEKLLSQLKANPALFQELAAAESDGPSAVKYGYVGGFRPEQMAAGFTRAVRKMKPGEMSKQPVKTQFGYHIIRRESQRPKHYSATLLLISHKDALLLRGMPKRIERTREDALILVEALARTVTPENFSAILAKNSNYNVQSGFLNIFIAGESAIYHHIAKALDHVPFEEVSGVVELEVGYALLKRHHVEQRAGARILICYIGSKYAPVHVSRTRSEARVLAEELLARLKAGPERVEDLANMYSEEPFGLRGGVLPQWFAGTGEKTLDRVVANLAIDELVSNIFETRRGFHIVVRRAPK